MEKTGKSYQHSDHRQYHIHLKGSGQITLRSSWFHWECTHISPTPGMQWIPPNLSEETDNQGEQQTIVENYKPAFSNIIEPSHHQLQDALDVYLVTQALVHMVCLNI